MLATAPSSSMAVNPSSALSSLYQSLTLYTRHQTIPSSLLVFLHLKAPIVWIKNNKKMTHKFSEDILWINGICRLLKTALSTYYHSNLSSRALGSLLWWCGYVFMQHQWVMFLLEILSEKICGHCYISSVLSSWGFCRLCAPHKRQIFIKELQP